jgi:hypothetical protein
MGQKASGTATAGVLVVVLVVGVFLYLLLNVLQAPRVEEGTPVNVPDPGSVLDPVEEGEPLPAGYRPVLERDGIAPIYEPRFLAADKVDYPDDALVLGVEIEGEAHAYPINVLNFREIVIDEVGGTPIIASW